MDTETPVSSTQLARALALRPFNDDVTTSRRYLVDEQFLDRGEGRYWRCGGSI